MKERTVLICNPDYLSSIGIRQILESRREFQYLTTLSNHSQLEQFLQQKKPDLIIIDYIINDSFSPESISLIKELSPESVIMVISNDHEKQRIFEVIERGVKSYITKVCGRDEILKALEKTIKGEKFFCNKVLDILLEKTFQKENQPGDVECLTQREKEILTLIGEGKTAKEISGDLHISIHTIYTHRKNIMKKLQLKSPVELIIQALNRQHVG